MKKFLMAIVCALCLCFIVAGCDGFAGNGDYVQNKALVVSDFNTAIDNLATTELINKKDLDFSNSIKTQFEKQTSINKKINFNYMFGKVDVDTPTQYLESSSAAASLTFANNEISLVGVVDGKNQNVSIYSDDYGLYFVTVEANGVATCNYYIPFDVTTAIFEHFGISGSTIDASTISQMLFGESTTLASYIAVIPDLTAEDVYYNKTIGVHTISNSYVKRAIDAIVDYATLGAGASSIKAGLSALVDNLGLEITYMVDSNSAVTSKIKINPNKAFFDSIYQNAYGTAQGAEQDRPVDTIKLEYVKTPTSKTLTFQIEGAYDLYLGGVVKGGAQDGYENLSVELDANLPVIVTEQGYVLYDGRPDADVSCIEATIDLSVGTDHNKRFDLFADVYVGAPNDVVVDFTASVSKSRTAFAIDADITQINLPNMTGVANAKDLKINGEIQFYANLTNGDFDGLVDLDVRDLLVEDHPSGVYVYKTIDVQGQLAGNLRNLVGQANALPIDLTITIDAQVGAEDYLTGALATLPEEYADQTTTIKLTAVNIQDGLSQVDGENTIVSNGITTQSTVIELTLSKSELSGQVASQVSQTLKDRFAIDKANFKKPFDVELYWDEKFLIDTYIEEYFGYNYDLDDAGTFYYDLGDGRYIKATFEYLQGNPVISYALVYADTPQAITTLGWVAVPQLD